MYAKSFTQITGLSATTWNTVDLDSFVTVEAGSNFAIIAGLRTSGTSADGGVRKVGSSDTQVAFSRRAVYHLVELDGNNQVEIYGNAVEYRIVGVGNEITFITPITKTLTQINAWQTVDLSGDGLSASAAYVVCRPSGDLVYRAFGESFENSVTAGQYNHRSDDFFVVPVDGSDRFEVHEANVAGQTLDVIGWIPSGSFVWLANPTLRTPSVASTWEDFPDSDSTVLIGLLDVKQSGSSSSLIGARTDGSSYTGTFNPNNGAWWIQTNSGLIEFHDSKASSTDTNFALRGGFKLTSAGGGSIIPKIMQQM